MSLYAGKKPFYNQKREQIAAPAVACWIDYLWVCEQFGKATRLAQESIMLAEPPRFKFLPVGAVGNMDFWCTYGLLKWINFLLDEGAEL